MMMDLVSEAIAFSTKAHDGMRRRNGDVPYILHPMEVGAIIGTMTNRVSLSVRPDFSVPLYCGEYQTFIKIISRI